MDAKQTGRGQTRVADSGFHRDRVTDFTHTPATLVDTKHAATIVKLEQVIEDLGGKEAIQAGGGIWRGNGAAARGSRGGGGDVAQDQYDGGGDRR